MIFFYFIIFSLYNCIIEVPVIINNTNFPLPIYMNSTVVRILVSGMSYVFIANTSEILSSTILTNLNYDQNVAQNTLTTNYIIQIVSKFNDKVFNIKYSSIDSENHTDIESFQFLNAFNLEEIKSISIVSKSIFPSLFVLSSDTSLNIINYDSNSGESKFFLLKSKIHYFSCENKDENSPIVCVYFRGSSTKSIYMVIILNINEGLSSDEIKIRFMSDSIGLKIFAKYNIFCSLTDNSYYECVSYIIENNNVLSYTIIKPILSDCSKDIKDFTLASFSYNNDLIACCSSNELINCQRISGTEKSSKFSINAENPSFIRNLGINSEEFLITYQCGSNSCLHFFFIPSCLNTNNFEANFLEKTILNFNSFIKRDTNTNYYISFIEINPNDEGDLLFGDEIIELNKNYLINSTNEFYFNHLIDNDNDNITIKYTISIEESYISEECSFSINIKKCFDNCLTCSEKSLLIDDQKCIQCKEEFYKINNTNNCFDISYINNGYYLYNNILYKCYENCLTCENTTNEIKRYNM